MAASNGSVLPAHTYVGLLDSPSEDEKLEMFLSDGADGIRITLRTIALSGLGWYPQKTITIHPVQLQSLEILIKRARSMLAGADRPDHPQVIRLPYLGCPAVADD